MNAVSYCLAWSEKLIRDVLNGSGEGKQDGKPAPPLLNTSAVKNEPNSVVTKNLS